MQKNPRNAQGSSIPSIPAEGSGGTLERPEVGADYYDDSAARNEKVKRSRAMTRGANLSRVTSEAGQLGDDAPHLVYDII